MNKSLMSSILLVIFGFSYFYKLYTLRSVEKVNANVLGRGSKGVELKRIEILLKATTFTWIVLWLYCIIYGPVFIPETANQTLAATETAGLIITALGVLFFEMAIYFMKSSWRVGVDEDSRTELITTGIYRYSRNPAFVGFDLMFAGLFFTYPDLLTLLVMVLNLTVIHLQILQEEKFLHKKFGAVYAEYAEVTPRYLIF